MKQNPILGIIGGIGFYVPEDLVGPEEHNISTPFGSPSGPITVGALEGLRVAFISRHGLGHTLSPSEINNRANIFALKSLGIERVAAISVCGSLREDYAPGNIVLPDQLYDHTSNRAGTFFSKVGTVAQIQVADPFCSTFTDQIESGLQQGSAVYHRGGSLITVDGPRFSTRLESNIFRGWGLSVTGMTTAPEAFLAREAEMCYSVISLITNYGAWKADLIPTSMAQVTNLARANLPTVHDGIKHLAANYDPKRNCTCQDALKDAIPTSPDMIPEDTRHKLSILIGKYFKAP